MSIFERLRTVPRPLSSADTGAVLAERQAYAEREAADAATAKDAYHAALTADGLSGLAVDTPAIERAAREHERAQQRAQRAHEAVAAAQADHNKAMAREAAAATKAYWDGLERLAAAHTAAGRQCTEVLALLEVALKKYASTATALFIDLPNAIKASPHYDAFNPTSAHARFKAEFERVVKGWPLASSGVPAPAPLADLGADMELMLRQARKDAGA